MDAFVISSLPPVLLEELLTVGFLYSPGITPVHCSYEPIRHPLAFGSLPSVSGYRTYLSLEISSQGKEGFSSCLVYPCYHAVATTPPKWYSCINQFSTAHAAFTLRLRAQPSGLRTFGATYAFAFATAWQLAIIPWVILSIDFRISVSLNPAIQATGLLTFTPAGLSPAKYTSLCWTYNRT